MLAVLTGVGGGPEVLRVGETPDPHPGAGQVLIEVEAAGVNRADLLQRQGLYPPPADASEILGLECAGWIAGLGAGVNDWSVGDRVMALLSGGGYAEQVVADAGSVMKIPESWTMVEGASFPEVYATAWLNLGLLSGLKKSDRVLVHGGSGGVGTAAIQLVRHIGASIAVTAGGQDRGRLCIDAGANAAFDYNDEAWPDQVREWTEGRGPDVILDCIGGSYFEVHQRLLALDGRWCIIGLMGGRTAEIDLGRLLGRRQTLVGSTLRSRSAHHKAELLANLVEVFGGAMEAGAVKPVIGEVVPMTEAAEAHRKISAGKVFGKAVLKV